MLEENTDSFKHINKLDPADNYQLKSIISGNYFSSDKKDVLLVSFHIDLSENSNSKFKINFATIDGNKLISGNRNYVFNGRIASIKSGDVNGDGLDDVVLHWSDSELHEWIGVLTPDGLAHEYFPPRQIPDDRREEIALADMDGDGIMEIVVPSLRTELSPKSSIDKINVYFIEKGNVRQESYAIIPAPVLDLVVYDTNKDGRDEIITLRSVPDENYEQAIWAIMRRDDGSYAERPLAKGNSISLVPSPTNSGSLYYMRIASSSGHFFNEIVAFQFDGDDFDKAAECRLLPEGLTFATAWGKFTSPDEESLAIIIDEALESRRWLTLYTPKVDDRFRNHLDLFAHDDFHPMGQSMTALDINGDGIDELVYIGLSGRIFAFDTINRKRKYLSLR